MAKVGKEALDALKKATDTWADTETTRLENESAFLKAVLQKRGMDRSTSHVLRQLESAIQVEADTYRS